MSGYDEVINPLIPRDRYKRPMIIEKGTGVESPYRRVTTFVDVLESKWNLQQWAQRKVVEGIASRRDLHMDAASLGAEPPTMIKNSMERWVKNPDHERWRTSMNEIANKAKDAAASDAKATIGTALHRFCERQDRGETLENVPQDVIAHLAAYAFATQRIEMIKIESFMVNDALRLGGTPDRIVRLPGRDKPMIFDIKTGSLEWGVLKMAMQLSVYAHSEIYDPETAERTHVDLDQEIGIICSLDAYSGEVVLLEIDIARGWEACKAAHSVWKWQGVKNLTKPLKIGDNTPSRQVEKENRRRMYTNRRTLDVPSDLALITALREADTEEELTAIYRDVERSAWTKDHTEHAKRRKAEILAALAFVGES